MFALPQSSHIIPIAQKSNEWYTPARYIEAARAVMNGIDLDPASCELANRTVKASRYYSKEDDGLIKPWHGRVWLNPPFGYTDGKSNMEAFTCKLIREYKESNVVQAILLCTSRADRTWFSPLWNYPICFTDHQVNFHQKRPTKARFKAVHIHGTIFVYLGPHEQKFIDIFSQFGRIAKAIDTPCKTVMPLSLWEAQ